ncbi:MAG: hypothetical protein AB7S26_11925 [Sandaracinaceae bacterium]
MAHPRSIRLAKCSIAVALVVACDADATMSDGGARMDAGARRDGGARSDGEAPRDAGARPDVMLPEGTGWIALPGTELSTICPDDASIHAVVGCAAVAAAWGGGAADTTHDRLLVWGGGHNDYWGNEIYALDLTTQTVSRITDPSPATPNPDDCGVTQLADGRPNSRHTYDNLAYIEHAHRMFAWGGAPACRPGGGSDDTWTFDVDAVEWTSMDPTNGGPPAAFIASTDYDAQTQLVLLHDTHGLWSYDVDTNTYAARAPDTATDYHMTGRVDPVHRLFVMIGGGQAWAHDLAGGYARRALDLTGCGAVVDAAYPGFAWDPVDERFIAWVGGGSVYAIDAVAGTCEELPYDGGPGDAQANGTNGRFRYFPALDVFALVNDFSEPAYILRLRTP